jgi:hypothetical protein
LSEALGVFIDRGFHKPQDAAVKLKEAEHRGSDAVRDTSRVGTRISSSRSDACREGHDP